MTIRVSHVIWGYLGGGVDSVLDSYLQVDAGAIQRLASHVIIVRPPEAPSNKLPPTSVPCTLITASRTQLVRAARLAGAAAREYGADVVVLNGFNATIFGYVLRRYLRAGTRVVCGFHGLYFERSLTGRLRGRLFNFLELRFFKRYASTVISVSDSGRLALIRRGLNPARIKVLHNAISPETDVRTEAPLDRMVGGEVKIITVSRLEPPKAIHVLIDAFAKVAARRLGTHLYIVGSGRLEAELRDQVNRAGLTSQVTFLGQRRDIAYLLSRADVFAMTSKQEEHSVAILEAMRAGLPLVVTDVGGNSESVRNGVDGFLVPDGNVERVAEALSELAADPLKRRAMGAQARLRFQSHFTLNKLLNDYCAILEEVVSPARENG